MLLKFIIFFGLRCFARRKFSMTHCVVQMNALPQEMLDLLRRTHSMEVRERSTLLCAPHGVLARQTYFVNASITTGGGGSVEALTLAPR